MKIRGGVDSEVYNIRPYGNINVGNVGRAMADKM